MKTVGISPKVKIPATALGVVGVVLVAASYAVEGLGGLQEAGFALIAASPFAGALGYKASPGRLSE